MFTKHTLHGRGADGVLPGKCSDGAASEVGLDEGLDVCLRQTTADLPGSRRWSIGGGQLGLFRASRGLLVDALQEADQGF